MELRIIIPDELLEEAIRLGLPEICLGVDKTPVVKTIPGKGRKKDKSKVREIKRAFIQPPTFQDILDSWNNSDFVRRVGSGSVQDSRNKPVPKEDLPQVIPLIRKAISMLGVEKIKERMVAYFQCCTEGRHIWEGTNHGFKHLGGFLTKVMNCEKASQIPWWELRENENKIEDRNPELTQIIADVFAQKFLKTASFNLDSSSSDRAKFVKAAEYLASVVESVSLPFDDPVTSMLNYLMNCVESIYSDRGEVVFPGALSSGSLWRIYLPQYMSEQLGLPSDTVSKISEVVQLVR